MVVGLDVVLADGTHGPHRRRARAAVGPDLTQLFVGTEGTLGVITGARLRVHPAPAGEVRARVPASPRSPTASTRAGASSDAARRPPCCASTTRPRPTGTSTTGDAARAARARRGRPRARRRDAWRSSPRSAPAPTPLDVALVEQWLEHRNDVSALEALISSGFVVDTMEIAGALVGAAARSTTRRARRAPGGRRARWLASRAPVATRTPTAPASTSPSPASPPTDATRVATTARCGTPARRAVLAARRRAQPPPRRRPQPGPLRAARRSAPAFDVLAATEGRARPERHPQPGQARPAEPMGRTRLAVKRLVLALFVVVVLGALALPAGSVAERHGRGKPGPSTTTTTTTRRPPRPPGPRCRRSTPRCPGPTAAVASSAAR